MAESMFKILLVLHIVAGTCGLISGTLNILRRKGGTVHRNIGKVFSWGMLVTGISAILLALLHPNYFLGIVGIFTLYMTLTGWRAMKRRTANGNAPVNTGDYVTTYGMVCAGIAFMIMGIYKLVNTDNFGIVMLVFGSISLLFTRVDLKQYASAQGNLLRLHLQRMTGAYIAALTAFLVVNAKYLPDLPAVVYWLLPTAILTPVIVIWSRKHA